MLQKFYVQLFTIIFLPLVACQLPGGQAAQPAEQPTPVPTALPTSTPITVTGLPLCDAQLATDRQARYTSGLIIGHYVFSAGELPRDDSEIVIINQQEEVSNVKAYVSEQTYELLTNTNFDSHFTVLVFEGKRKNLVIPEESPIFAFCIAQWQRDEKDVTISLQLIQQDIGPSVVFYTYFCFQVARDETWKGDFTFKLNQTRYTYTFTQDDGIVTETKFTFQ